MSYSYDIRTEAVIEFADAYIWYEEQKDGLGNTFTKAVYAKLSLIITNPFHYKIVHKNHRQALVQTFPFVIVYTVNERSRHITVMAIFHTSRNPKRKLRK